MADDEAFNLYFYPPSTAAAILFTVLYGITAFAHNYMLVFYPSLHHRKTSSSSSRPRPCSRHHYTIPTAIAAALSTAGYANRIASIKQPTIIGLYATSASLIVIAPIFVCATVYLLFARLIVRCLPTTSTKTKLANPQVFFGITPRWMGRVFITLDVLSFMTQGAGTSIAAGANWVGNDAKVGTNVLLVGLALQLATFSVFLVFLWLFVCRVRAIVVEGGGRFEPNVKSLLLGLGVAGVFIEIRSIYRVVEFALGVEGYPFSHEWTLYVLEAVPMLIAIAVLAWTHPMRLMPEGVRGDERKGSGSGSAGGDVEQVQVKDEGMSGVV